MKGGVGKKESEPRPQCEVPQGIFRSAKLTLTSQGVLRKSGNRFFAESMLYIVRIDHVVRLQVMPLEGGVI
jgi:hypothetical protein